MRFNTQVVTVALAIYTANAVEVCPSEIVAAAASQDILGYTLLNCVQYTGKVGKNLQGTTLLLPGDCLTAFIATSSHTNAIPDTGSCRNAFQGLMTDIAALSSVITTKCLYDSEKKDITIGYDCALSINGALNTFALLTGYSISQDVCRSDLLRARSVSGTYGKLLNLALNGVVAFPVDLKSVEDGLCDMCYANFLTKIGVIDDGTHDDVVAACLTDHGQSNVCKTSTVILPARTEFEECSGYDVDFKGPVCTQKEVEDIQELIPTPYFTFTHCAYNNEAFCSTITAYFDQIEKESSDTCVLCYREFNDALLSKQHNADTINACTGPMGVWDVQCLDAYRDALSNFRTCSGFDLDTKDVAHVVPTTTSEPVTTITTIKPLTSITTTASVTTSTSGGNTIHVTKGFDMVTTVGVVVIAAVAMML